MTRRSLVGSARWGPGRRGTGDPGCTGASRRTGTVLAPGTGPGRAASWCGRTARLVSAVSAGFRENRRAGGGIYWGSRSLFGQLVRRNLAEGMQAPEQGCSAVPARLPEGGAWRVVSGTEPAGTCKRGHSLFT